MNVTLIYVIQKKSIREVKVSFPAIVTVCIFTYSKEKNAKQTSWQAPTRLRRVTLRAHVFFVGSPSWDVCRDLLLITFIYEREYIKEKVMA